MVRLRQLLLILLVAVWGGCSAHGPRWGDAQLWRQALPELRARAAADPGDREIRARLALSLLYAGEPAAADSVAAGVLESSPRDALAWYVKAVIAERRGEWARADSIYGLREQLADAPSGLPEIMAARQGLALQQILRERLRGDLARARAEQGLALEPLALIVHPFTALGDSRQDSLLALGVTHYLTNSFALIDTLVVVDNTRRRLLEQEIRQSQSEAFQSATRLVARTIGASLAVGGRAGEASDPENAARVQYGIEDLLIATAEETYRGTRAPVEFTSPTRYLLADLGEQVVRIAEENLRLPLDEELRARLVRPRTGDFDAFLAYAEGLYWEERYQYGRAHQHFQEAERIDSGFEDAREGAARTGGGGPEAAPPPGESPLPADAGDLAEEAAAQAGQAVDEMPGQRAEEPAPTPGAQPGRVRIIVRPQSSPAPTP